MARGDPDPVVKYDGSGEPVRLSGAGLNRAGRRQLARQMRRERVGGPVRTREVYPDGDAARLRRVREVDQP